MTRIQSSGFAFLFSTLKITLFHVHRVNPHKSSRTIKPVKNCDHINAHTMYNHNNNGRGTVKRLNSDPLDVMRSKQMRVERLIFKNTFKKDTYQK